MNAIAYFYPTKIISLAFPRISQKWLLVLGLVFIAAMACLFLWQNNQIVSKAYLLQDYQKKLSELKKENAALQLSAFQGNSLEVLEKQVQSLGMEKTERVEFIRVLGSAAVTRK